MVFTLGFPINNSSDPIGPEAVGASSDKLMALNSCKELFFTVITSYDYVHIQPLIEIGCVRI